VDYEMDKNMIVCVCRNISDQQYSTKEELVERLLEEDLQCSACMNYIKELKKNVEHSQKKV
jgi:signal recognition particle GTPase